MVVYPMLQKKEGLTLGEKIEKHLKKIKKKGLISLIDDSFFGEEVERGCQFYVRRTNLMRSNRTLHIIDEIEERIKLQKAFEEQEAKRDMTYEEFLQRY